MKENFELVSQFSPQRRKLFFQSLGLQFELADNAICIGAAEGTVNCIKDTIIFISNNSLDIWL